ncbi:MAG: GAF domain-containing sensor histidine kinase [Candidatus Dormibacteria bacterium]
MSQADRVAVEARVQEGLNPVLAIVVLVASLLAVAACVVLLAADQLTPPVHPTPDLTPRIGFPVLGVAFAIVGGALGARRQSAVIGWLFAGVGISLSVGALLYEYGTRAEYVTPGLLPAGDVGIWVGDWLPFVMLPAIPILLQVFPTGRLLSRRWRLPMAVAIVAMPMFLLQDMFSSTHLPGVMRHGAAAAVGMFFQADAVGMAANLLAGIAAFSALASLVVRIRRAESVERHQLKWFGYAAGLVVVTVLLGSVAATGIFRGLGVFFGVLFIAAFASVPVSVGIAVLKYRLYDIDVVISRTLVYGAMAAFITSVYVGIVVGAGTLVGSGGKPNLVLSIVATAVVAVAFQPVRERLQKLANRMVYGKRATPYEVLSEFSGRVGESFGGEGVLPRMAQVLAEGTGAQVATVWLRSGSRLRPAAVWPASTNGHEGEAEGEGVEVQGQVLPGIPGADRLVPVRHQGELLGALAINKRPGESLTPIEDKLLDDLALQAGMVLKNVGLTADLQARLEDLRASRQRLVAAQDHERRRLERDLHDGAQQHLVALKVKLGLAEALTAKDPDQARATIQQLKIDADEALETLRDLARGIYPPLLADKGLVAALEAQARKAMVPVAVQADGVSRHPQETEAAVYFCCLEALQNVQKYAGATRVTVRLHQGQDELRFEVEDDGAGFDAAHLTRGSGLQNMDDRLAALDGQVRVDSSPGAGTTVIGTLPLATPAGGPGPGQATVLAASHASVNRSGLNSDLGM